MNGRAWLLLVVVAALALAGALSLVLPVLGPAPGAAPTEARRSPPTVEAEGPRPPNVVLIVADDLGINDVGSYHQQAPGGGPAAIPTPHLDQLAAEGMRFTDFAVAASVCTPSRAALLTGCYPPRVGFAENFEGGVLLPDDREGLHPDEQTLAEVLAGRGYRTAYVGKWHLGHAPELLPTRQGFDDFYGLPYSHNLSPAVILRDEKVVRRLPENPLLTGPLVRAVEGFFDQLEGGVPFLLVVAFTAPHEPWAVPPEWRGRTARGPYGDVVAQLDAAVGDVLQRLDASGHTEDTLVLFLSDNGPWVDAAGHPLGGDAYPWRGGKATLWEGGFRSPLLVRWPGHVPAATVNPGFVTSLDILPTLAALAGAPLPERPIDGLDVSALLADPAAPSPREGFAYFARGRLEAVRLGSLKRVFEAPRRDPPVPAALYDLAADPGETTDLTEARPADLARLEAWAEAMRAELGDALTGAEGTARRPLWSP